MKSLFWIGMLIATCLAPLARGEQFLLDGTTLYSGWTIRSSAPPNSTILTAKELFKRVKKQPRGSQLRWMPSLPKTVDENGEPILIAPGVLADLKLLCEERGISFDVTWHDYAGWSMSPIL